MLFRILLTALIVAACESAPALSMQRAADETTHYPDASYVENCTDISSKEERLTLPDPLIRCGGEAGRSIEGGPAECNVVTTRTGYVIFCIGRASKSHSEAKPLPAGSPPSTTTRPASKGTPDAAPTARVPASPTTTSSTVTDSVNRASPGVPEPSRKPPKAATANDCEEDCK